MVFIPFISREQLDLWRLECFVVETVASLLRGVTEHCLIVWTRSHYPDKVNDIQAVRKSSTDQCNSSGDGPLLFLWIDEKNTSFPFQETPTLTLTFHLTAAPFEIPILEKGDGKRRSFLEWKTCIFFIDSQKTKSGPELLHWSVENFLTAWMSSTLSGQWLRVHAWQCSVTPRKSDALAFSKQAKNLCNLR